MTRPAILFVLLLTACGASPPPNPPMEPYSCTVDSDCMILLRPCCTPCAPWTEDQVEAVRRVAADARHHVFCPEPTTCPQCVAFPPPAGITAVCIQGACAIAHTTEPPHS